MREKILNSLCMRFIFSTSKITCPCCNREEGENFRYWNWNVDAVEAVKVGGKCKEKGSRHQRWKIGNSIIGFYWINVEWKYARQRSACASFSLVTCHFLQKAKAIKWTSENVSFSLHACVSYNTKAKKIETAYLDEFFGTRII